MDVVSGTGGGKNWLLVIAKFGLKPTRCLWAVVPMTQYVQGRGLKLVLPG